MKIVIVGLSAAGLSALETFLSFSNENLSITAITEERYDPYSRCLLTHYLGKELTLSKIFIANPKGYPKNVKLLFSQKVLSVDTKNKTVFLTDNNKIQYDKLLLATGADPVKPEYVSKHDRVFTLRYLDDANRIESKLKEKATVFGGGFVGIKTAYGLVERGVNVHLVISSSYPLSMLLDKEMGHFIQKKLTELGISVITASDIVGIEKKPDGVYVVLSSGKPLSSDVVIVGKGVNPRTELATKSGIKTNKGIIVNEFLETSEKDVFAAGDCIEFFDIAKRECSINAIWPNAVEQGYFAAMNMLGKTIAYKGTIGYNSLKTKNFHLITAGVLKGEGIEVYSHYEASTKQLRKVAFRNNIPVGMAFLNCPNEAGVLVNLIKRGETINITPEEIVKGKTSLLKTYFKR